ncbi:MAG: VCBS repeat-containing protein, partial [Pirellulaceae bacterium]|nr:VCBS repeat-containing protein [Pirellulaceae bacterium]
MLVTLLTGVSITTGCGSGGSASSGGGEQVPEVPLVDPFSLVVSTFDEPDGAIWFEWVQKHGIDFVHASGTSKEKPFPAANGSGLAAIDFDRDGFPDLYFASGTPIPVAPTETSPRDCFYRNRGDFQFEDVTAESYLGHAGYSAGVAVGDYDSDGFADIYVTCYGKNELYQNMGDGTFALATEAAGLGDTRFATSAAFFDYNDDGLLDIYLCNYGTWTPENNPFCGNHHKGIRMYCGPASIPPVKDALFRNDGDGHFTDVLDEAGLGGRSSRAQGVVAFDANNDGWIDVYLGNDLHENSFFINTKEDSFADRTEESGVAYDEIGREQAGMGVDAADTDGDGTFELFVTNFAQEHNTLYQLTGDSVYSDVTGQRQLKADSMPYVGWGTVFADFDLDTELDLIVTNGHVDDNLIEAGKNEPYEAPPLLWRNREGRFERHRKRGGGYFVEKHVGRALACADLDNDGDPDLVIGHQDTPPALLRNNRLQADSKPASITLQLVGVRSNREAIGSTVRTTVSGKPLVRQVKGGGSYLSTHDRRLILPAP